MRSGLALLVRKLLSLSRRGYCSFVVSLVLGCSLSWTNPLVAELHARWAPDFTVSPPQWQCVTGGTVAGPVEFQLIVGYKNNETIPFIYCNYIELTEQTNVHTPQTFRVNNPTGTYVSPSQISNYCSSPPPNCDIYIVFSAPPSWGFACHNTSYRAKASYTYKQNPYGQPPPAQTGEVSITVNFNNLIVNSTPKILKWDPNNSANRDTTISYSLSSAQEKNCQVVIMVYDMGGNVIYQTALNQHCPGSYSFTWDGTRNQGGMPPGMTAPLGLYTYDITVQGPPPLEEGDRMRSRSLSISSQNVIEIEEGRYQVKYLLQDSKDASQAGVDVYAPDFQKIAGVTDGTAKSPTWNETEINVEPTIGGTYYFLFWAVDNYPEMDKAHRQKPALEVSSTKHIHGWIVEPNIAVTVDVTPRYIRVDPAGNAEVSLSITAEDRDTCDICGATVENDVKLISVSDGGKGGEFGYYENGVFKAWTGGEGQPQFPTVYKCPTIPSVVPLQFTFDDIPYNNGKKIGADDNPINIEASITVWDFTIDEGPLAAFLPSYGGIIGGIQAEIKPTTDHNGNSLASFMTLTIRNYAGSEGSSQELGVCKNASITEVGGNPEQEKWDLQFSESMSSFTITSDAPNDPYKRSRAVSTQGLLSAWIVINCYDWGAYGKLYAQANIPNIGTQMARNKRRPEEQFVRIPIDDNENYIADRWEQQVGSTGAPTDDTETEPAGANVGDGLSRYDEYRGFIVEDGSHITTDPKKKDVFIMDINGLGVSYFAQLGLNIWFSPLTDETQKVTRFDTTAHIRNQYAIKLVESFTPDPSDPYFLGKCWSSLNSPGVRATIYTSVIDDFVYDYYSQRHPDRLQEWQQFAWALKQKTIAHELGHAVNLPEHDVVDCIMRSMETYDLWDQGSLPTSYCGQCKAQLKLYK